MKKKSIRFKLTLWFCAALALVVGLTFAAVRIASSTVLRATIRDYLIGAVEENIDKIGYSAEPGEVEGDINIPYSGGALHIDSGFMDIMNDVFTALYTDDGTMLYGENPLAKKTSEISFSGTRLWNIKVDGERYDIYDRDLNIKLSDGQELWIRGIVPETRSTAQLGEITRLSLFLLPLLIIIAAAVGYIIVDRLLSPLGRIEAAAEEISKGDDLHKRIDEGDSSDEVGRLAGAFNRMFDRLENAFESERQFTSDASHELRTPTSVILAQTEYTLEKDRDVEEYKEALEVVGRQGRRMKMLIDDMLDYTRMDQDPGRYTMESLDLSKVVSETAEQLRPVPESPVKYIVDIEPDIAIDGNELLISRMVQNLISNALRYGGEDATVETRLFTEGGKPVITVRDDGPGIAPEEQEKIFDRFYRSDSSRSVQGTGLGLSMVKKIAQIHGAEVSLESEPGKGSCFRISF